MPSLEQTLIPAPPNYVPVQNPQPPIGQASTGNLLPTQNPNMRCPVPQTNFSPDASTQFYRGTTVPQYRTFSPAPLTGSTSSGTSGGSTTTNVTNNTTNTTVVTLSVKNASITTPVLNPGDSYTSVLSFSRAFIVFLASATAAARIRLYATANAQTLDQSRAATVAPAFGIAQGLIMDVTLDTSPYLWLMTPPPSGANGDSPTSPVVYITVDQIAAMSGPITASLSYLPLES